MESEKLIELTAEVAAAHLANNSVAVSDVATLIQNVHNALAGLGEPAPPPPPAELVPAVSIRSSIKPDRVTCLDCGLKMKMLKRHIMTDHGLTPDQYRERWGLAPDYPMVAPEYAEQRRALAVSIGLGTKRRRGR